MAIAQAVLNGFNAAMEAFFNKMRQIQGEIDRGKEPLLRSYQGQLISSSSWYLALTSIQGLRPLVRETSVRALNRLENNPRAQIVESPSIELEFAREELPENTKNLKELSDSKKIIIANKAKPGVDSPGSSLGEYFKQLDGCHLCPEKCSSAVYEKQENYSDIEIMFVGDFPITTAQDSAHCFQGARRELLLNMIKAMQLSTEQYVLTLAVKCSSENDELGVKTTMVTQCIRHLENEISLIKPKVVVALGAFVANHLLGERKKLSLVHGQFFEKSVNQHHYQVVPVFHPDFLLINPKMKQTAWIDLKKIIKFLHS